MALVSAYNQLSDVRLPISLGRVPLMLVPLMTNPVSADNRPISVGRTPEMDHSPISSKSVSEDTENSSFGSVPLICAPWMISVRSDVSWEIIGGMVPPGPPRESEMPTTEPAPLHVMPSHGMPVDAPQGSLSPFHVWFRKAE